MKVKPKESMVRIIRPDFRRYDRDNRIVIPTLSDYIEVPRLSTFGTWQIVETLPMETLARLQILRESLAGGVRRKA